MNNENNKFKIDIDNLFKQNANDLSAIKELYRKLKEVEEKFSQIKYIDSTLANKLQKEYEKLKRLILDENAQAELADEIETLNTKLKNDIKTINSQFDSVNEKINNDVELINSQLDTFKYERVNVRFFGAKGDGVTDDTESVKKALKTIPNGGELYFPTCDKFYIVNGVELSSYVRIVGSTGVTIKRNKDTFIFRAIGEPKPTGGTPDIYGIQLENLRLGSVYDFYSDLVVFKGCTALKINKVTFDAYNCKQLTFEQVYDTRISNCEFWNGGRESDDAPCLELGGGSYGYKQSMEIFISDCWFESYRGPAISTTRKTDEWKVTTILMNNIKFESKFRTKHHLLLNVSNLQVSNVYVTTEKTTTDVIKFESGRCIKGDFRFYYVTAGVIPNSLINFDSNCHLVDVDILVSEPQPTNANVVTLASNLVDSSVIRLNIMATQPLVNNKTHKLNVIKTSRIKQYVADDSNVAYEFAKNNHPIWSFGNLYSDGDNYDSSIKADNVEYLTFRSRGNNVSNSYREMIAMAYMQFGYAWNTTRLPRFGNYTIWVDSVGELRIKNGLPESDFDGTPVGRKLYTDISVNPIYVGQEAIVDGIWYKAIGTSSPTQWKQITN